MKKKFNYLSLVILLSITLHANITGTIFEDLPLNGNNINTYAVKDINEQPVKDVTVTAYFNDPLETQTTQTLADGSWELNITTNARIEFSNWPSYLQVSPNSNVNNSSVRFASNGDDISLGLHNPNTYTDTINKYLIISLQNNGLHLNNNNATLKIVPPVLASQDNNPNDVIDIATSAELGSIWGVAYDKVNKIAYTSAMLRRHVDVGDLGLGGIYKIDLNDINNPSISNFTTIANAGDILLPNDRNLSINSIPSHDPVFAEVGKIGLGDMDIDEKNQMLYTVNINTNQLIKIDINNP